MSLAIDFGTLCVHRPLAEGCMLACHLLEGLLRINKEQSREEQIVRLVACLGGLKELHYTKGGAGDSDANTCDRSKTYVAL